MRGVLLGLALWTGVLGAVGCDEGTPEGIKVLETGGTRVSAVVGQEGAVLELSSGAKLDIPRGALDEDTEIEVAETQRSALADDPSEARSLEKPLALTPHGTRFNKDIELELPLSRDNQELEVNGLRVLRLDDESDTRWEDTGVKLEKRADTVAFKIDRFSVYMLAEAVAGEDAADAGGDFEQEPTPTVEDAGRPSDIGEPPDTVKDASVRDTGTPSLDPCQSQSVQDALTAAENLSDLKTSWGQCSSSCTVHMAPSGTCYYAGDSADTPEIDSADTDFRNETAKLTSEEISAGCLGASANLCQDSVMCNTGAGRCEIAQP